MIILALLSSVGSGFLVYGLIHSLVNGGSDSYRLVTVLLFSLFSTISCIAIFFSFRSTTSFEIFFYYLFLFTISFDIFKINGVFQFAESFWNTYPMLMTRLIYYGKLTGSLALLSAGLFSTGLEYHRIGVTALLVMVIPAALVMVLPVDTSEVMIGETWKIGGIKEIFSAMLLLDLMAILNFLIAGSKNENKDYYILAAILFLSVTGRELSFYLTQITIQAGSLILLIVGTSLFSFRVHRLYMWN